MLKHATQCFVLASLVYLGFPSSDALPQSRQSADAGNGVVHVLRVQGNVYMLTGAGGNITVQTGKNGVVLVDTGRREMSDQVVAVIRTISNAPIRVIVNTGFDPDHTGGNAAIDPLGSTITDDNFLSDLAGSGMIPGAKLVAPVKLFDRMTGPGGDSKAAPA